MKTLNDKKKYKGFTLIELLVVIAILALLIAIAIPKYNNSKEKSLVVAHNSNVRVLEGAAMNFLADKGTDEVVVWTDDESASEYVKDFPKVPKGLKGIEEKSYTVTINPNGEIIISPEAIKE